MKENKLYVIVYEQQDGEPEWFFRVLDYYPSQREAEKLVEEAYKEYHGFEDEDEFDFNNEIGSVWVNRVDTIDNFKINVDRRIK